MPDSESTATTVNDMPLHELRVRTREVQRLLRSARDHVSASFGPEAGASADGYIARLHGIFEEVQELLPGLVRLGPGERRRLEDEERAGADGSAQDDDVPASLTPADLEKARRILLELREGMERMDLLDSIASGIDELLAMIEAGRAELRRQLDIELADDVGSGRRQLS